MKIIIDDKIPFIRGVLEKSGAQVTYAGGAKINAELVRDADALIVRTRTICNETLLANTPVKIIATATIGYDHLDTNYLKERNIAWSNAPGCNAPSVANYLASVLVTLEKYGKLKLHNSTLGVVGVGHVGSRVAQLGETLGMRVLRYDPPRAETEGPTGFCDLATLQQECDLISCHVPRAKTGPHATENMVNAAWLQAMKKGAWFVNTSRGEVVDEAALKRALKKKHLAGAILDVWRNEPEIDPELVGMVFGATPHIAGYSADGKANGTAQAVRAVSHFFGLGLEEWYPAEIPAPEQPEITLPEGDRLYHAVTASYDFLRDDAALRGQLTDFELQRGNYPLRREFPAYTILNPGADAALLTSLGFKLHV